MSLRCLPNIAVIVSGAGDHIRKRKERTASCARFLADKASAAVSATMTNIIEENIKWRRMQRDADEFNVRVLHGPVAFVTIRHL